MSKSDNTPSTPDPYKVAAAQTQSNNSTAAYNKALNATNTTTPFGSTNQVQTGVDPTTGAPIYSTTTSANSDVQSLISSLLGSAGTSGTSLSTALSGLSGLSSKYDDINSQLSGLGTSLAGAQQSAADAAQKGTDTYYNQAMAYLQPQQAQATTALQSQLANQGLVPGTQAYNNAAANLSRSQAYTNNQALDTAQTQGQQLGLNQLTAAEGLASTQAGLLQNQASNLNNQGTNYTNLATASSVPYNQLSAIASLLPSSSTNNSATSANTDLSNDVYSSYSGDVSSANAKTASNNSLTSGLFSLGGTLLGSSSTSTIGSLLAAFL